MSDDMFPFEEKAHYHLFENRITLAVIAANTKSAKDTRFLVTTEGETLSLPYQPLRKGLHSQDTAKKLFSKMTGLDPTAWTLIQQTGFVDTKEDYQIVLYSVMIPDSVALLDSSAKWVTVDELIDDHMRRVEHRPTPFDLFAFASHTTPLGIYQ
jgi:hypothetical protein